MRGWIAILAFVLLPSVLTAQTTSVSGTITDAGGVVWKNGNYTFTFTPSPNNPTANYFQNGVPFNKFTTISGNLDATGSLTSVAIPDNLTITPSGSTWAVKMCSASTASNGCFTTQLTITGASQSITASVIPPAIILDLTTPPPGGASAYIDGEIIGARIGSQYFNLTDSTIHVCTFPLCTWVAVGATSNTLPGGSPIQAQFNNSGSFGGSPCISLNNLATGSINQDCDTHFKGTNPYVDVTRYGVRSMVSPNTTTTATVSSGLTSVTLSSAADFITGEGVVIFKAGPAPTIGTPSLTGASATPKGITGSTTHNYQIVAEDFFGGLTAATGNITTTTAAATLGSNTLSPTAISRNSAGLVTVTAANSLAAGAKVNISALTGPSGNLSEHLSGVFVVTSATGASFTVKTPGTAPYTASATGATIYAEAFVVVKWAVSTGNVLRYWVYRDGTLAGVAQGNEPVWVDDGYAAPSAPSYVPTSAPVAVQNQSLATIITAGGTTTAITIRDSASVSQAGLSILHDNSQTFQNALAAATAIKGASLFFPNPSAVSGLYYFNSTLILPPPASRVFVQFAGPVNANNPWLINGTGYSLLGVSPASTSSNPSFSITHAVDFTGSGYPLIQVLTSSSFSINALNIAASASQQSGLVFDVVSGGPGSVNNDVSNSVLSAAHTGCPVTLRGGSSFNYKFVKDVFSGGSGGDATNNFFSCASFHMQASIISNPVAGIGIVFIDDPTFITSGIEGVNPTGTTLQNGFNSVFVRNIFTESFFRPFVYLESFGCCWSIQNVLSADTAVGLGTPVIELTNGSALNSVMLENVPVDRGMFGGFVPSGLYINSGQASSNLFTTPGFGSFVSNSPQQVETAAINGFPVSGPQTMSAFEVAGSLRLSPPATTTSGEVFIDIGVPTDVSAIVSAGGAVSVGTHTYTVVGTDADGHTTVPSAGVQATTTPGNQTVTYTWNPIPSYSTYAVYEDALLKNGASLFSCCSTVFTTAGNSGRAAPFYPSSGTPRMEAAGIFTVSGPVAAGAYSTASATSAANIAVTTMATAGASGNKYVFSASATQVAAGTSCTTNTTVNLQVNYTDATTSAGITVALGGYSAATNTFVGNTPVLAVNNGNASQNQIQWVPVTINAKASTVVQYQTIYTAGTGCSPAPTYYVQPSLIQVQ